MDKQPVAVKLGGIYAVLRFDEVFFWLSIFSGCASHLVVHFGSLYGTPSSNIKKKIDTEIHGCFLFENDRTNGLITNGGVSI